MRRTRLWRALRAGSAAALACVLVVGVAPPAAAAPGPPDAPEYWFDQWRIPDLWAAGARGGGVTIAEIDTGVNASLPELRANVLHGKDFGMPGDGRVDREVTQFGHGTAMASIMVGQRGILNITGIAPDARLLPIAVPLIGTTDSRQDDHLADAIRWASDHGGKVISMSLGGGRHRVRGADPCPADEQEAIYHALRKGSIVVAASGNNGPTTNTVEEPGVCLGVVSVGAVDSTGTVASFSSRHPYLTMTAPGVNIASLSRVPGTAYSGEGTSQATAIVSAVFALVWSKFPTLTNRQVVGRVLATLDRHRTIRDPAYGYGTVNAYRAVTANVPRSAPSPVFSDVDPFLRRSRAFANAAKGPIPLPAGAAKTNVGSFRIGSAPRLLVPKVLTGLATCVAGLIALLILGVIGWVRRRHRADAALAEMRAISAEFAEHSFQWRHISGPPDDYVR